jgi:outer membrane protein assembly factor BamB
MIISISSVIFLSGMPLILSANTSYKPYFEQFISRGGNDWWSTYRHNPLHTGYSSSSSPDSDELLWSYLTDDFISSSPCVSHGKMYIGSWDFNLYCFNMDNGDIIWKYKTNGQITSSPAVENGKIYFGSKDDRLYCLNANDGSYLWDYETGYMIESSPTVKNGRVFFGSSDGSFYCLDANDGSYIWSYNANSVIWSSPAVTDQSVYFGTLGGVFYCLDVSNGDFIWSFVTTSGIWSSPTISNGSVYFGANDHFLYRLDKEDGDYIWSYDTGGEVHSSPAIAYGNVYIGALDQGLFCLNADTGNLVWKYLIGGGIWSPPCIADDKIYFGTYPCCGLPTYIRCIDAHTGDILWKHNTGSNVGMKTSAAIAAGKVFFGTGIGEVIVFGEIQFIADANGPYNNNINVPIHFNGSVYGGEPDYLWLWDFGDGSTSNKKNPIHTYVSLGEYNVTLTVTDSNNNIASDETFVIIEIPSTNNPPNMPLIDGPISGKTGVSYNYTFNVVDPDGDNITMCIDFGDDAGAVCYGPVLSGKDLIVSHTWDEKDIYIITAYATDIHGLKGSKGTLEVTMPKNKQFLFDPPLLSCLFNRFPNMFPILIRTLTI